MAIDHGLWYGQQIQNADGCWDDDNLAIDYRGATTSAYLQAMEINGHSGLAIRPRIRTSCRLRRA